MRRVIHRIKFIATVFTVATLALSGSSPATTLSELREVQHDVQAQLSKLGETIVTLDSREGTGTGVIVEAEGIILTAAHVCGERGTKHLITLSDGTEVSGTTLGLHIRPDLGLVQIEELDSPLPTAALADPDVAIESGQWCFALGHPWGLDAERGTVLRVGKILRNGKYRLQTDCELLGGDSGGPLFNLDGEVIGIHSFIGAPLTFNYHGSTQILAQSWDTIRDGGRLFPGRRGEKGFLGVGFDSDSPEIIISKILKDSAADAADLKLGDQILGVDDDLIDDQETFLDYLSFFAPEDSITLDLLRDEELLTKTITLGERPKLTKSSPSRKADVDTVSENIPLLPEAAHTNGSETLSAAAELLFPAQNSVFEIKKSGTRIGLATVLTSDGYLGAKASDLPPIDGKLKAISKEQSYSIRHVQTLDHLDLAVLKIDATDLVELHWLSKAPAPLPTGTWLASPTPRTNHGVLGVVAANQREIARPDAAIGIVMGIEGHPITGVQIIEVRPHSAGAAAGLKEGDTILRVNDAPITLRQEVKETVTAHSPGDSITLSIRREQTIQDIDVILGDLSIFFEMGQRNRVMSGRTSQRKFGFSLALQHDGPLRPKEMGGPVIDLEGRAIGINIARIDRTSTFTLPAATFLPEAWQAIEADRWAQEQSELTDTP